MKMFLAACLIFALSPAARAEPAIWLVQSPTAKIYLFGTMHILPKTTQWFGPKIAAAFDDSAVLFEEADIGFSDPAVQSRIMNEAVSPDIDLFAMLPPKTAGKLRDLVHKCHMPANIVAHFQLWFAGMLPTLCSVIAESHGAPTLGPESIFINKAKQAGKEVDFFETAEQQIGYLSGASQTAQLEQLQQALDEGDAGEDFVGMEKSWQSGDVPSISALIVKSRIGQEDSYQTLYVHRNERFATRIAQLLRGHENVFVAVGAGHFAGPDSVQSQLGKQGIVAKRL